MKRLKREGVALTELRIAVCTKLYQIQKVTEYEVLNKQSIKGIIKVMQTSFPLPALKIHANSHKIILHLCSQKNWMGVLDVSEIRA